MGQVRATSFFESELKNGLRGTEGANPAEQKKNLFSSVRFFHLTTRHHEKHCHEHTSIRDR
jgi:hypothetical protein